MHRERQTKTKIKKNETAATHSDGGDARQRHRASLQSQAHMLLRSSISHDASTDLSQQAAYAPYLGVGQRARQLGVDAGKILRRVT